MAEFDATEGGWLYKKLVGCLSQLAIFTFALVPTLVLVFVFVFVPQYWLPPKLVAGVQSLMFFKS